jgi:thiol:disulfide interchange protein DsbD
MGAAGSLASKHGAAGAFFNGVLATVLATPCTAPFLSIALGFAFAQGAVSIVTIFLTIGLGLASPYVLLSWNPAWLSFVPKPGAWMERFKIAMGFPMLATAVWLFSLLPIHYGERSWWVGIFLVIVALAAWVYGEFIQRGRTGHMAAGIIVGLLLLLGYAGVLERRLHWREVDSGPTAAIVNEPTGIAWQKWSTQAVEQARAEGRPVLVDFTAKWCVTCNAIVKPALEADEVRKKVEQIGAVALLADYTKFPPEITQELSRFGRAGVPLVLAYPKNAAEPPIVLPEPSPLRGPGHYSEIVLGALEQASR